MTEVLVPKSDAEVPDAVVLVQFRHPQVVHSGHRVGQPGRLLLPDLTGVGPVGAVR
jgi:hypothetical protein